MTGLGVKAARMLLAGAALPGMAAAQTNGAAPQTIPGLDRFNLPPSSRPTPAPTPISGPVIAPLPTPTPTPSAAAGATPVPGPAPIATPAPRRTPALLPTPRVTSTPQPSPTSSPADATAATPSPSPAPAPPLAPAATADPASGALSQGWIVLGIALVALAAALWFLFRRRPAGRERVEQAPVGPPPAPEPSPLPPSEPAPANFLTVPLRARRSDAGEPRVEIVLLPRRAGTNLTGAAVDYRVLIRNTGPVAVRDVRFAMYMLSASARQAQDLQAIFATAVDRPAAPPFDLPPAGEIELSGMALLARERVNVMTIEGQPRFVPVLAMKADYRWGDNVGAPGVVTAAHMIGIDRGEGAKLAPFRLDGAPMMHSRVAARQVA